jgi:hypothetical protein
VTVRVVSRVGRPINPKEKQRKYDDDDDDDDIIMIIIIHIEKRKNAQDTAQVVKKLKKNIESIKHHVPVVRLGLQSRRVRGSRGRC